jgi:hypothetical protein
MPLIPTYPEITTLADDDVLIVYENASQSVKRITKQNLALSLLDVELPQTNVTSNTTLVASDSYVVGSKPTNFEVTLCASSAREGKPTYFVNKGVGQMILKRQGLDTIYNGTTTVTDCAIPRYHGAVLIASFGTWHVMGPVSATPP